MLYSCCTDDELLDTCLGDCNRELKCNAVPGYGAMQVYHAFHAFEFSVFPAALIIPTKHCGVSSKLPFILFSISFNLVFLFLVSSFFLFSFLHLIAFVSFLHFTFHFLLFVLFLFSFHFVFSFQFFSISLLISLFL